MSGKSGAKEEAIMQKIYSIICAEIIAIGILFGILGAVLSEKNDSHQVSDFSDYGETDLTSALADDTIDEKEIKPVSAPELDKKIRQTLKQRKVYDVNGDGNVDCIDYANVFKNTWEATESPYICELVWNKNPSSGMNHLFVRVGNQDVDWIYVEPQTFYKENYLMQDFWRKQYDSDYNLNGAIWRDGPNQEQLEATQSK